MRYARPATLPLGSLGPKRQAQKAPHRLLGAVWRVWVLYEKPRRLPAQFYPDQFYDIRVRVPPPDNLGVSNGWTVGLWPDARGSSTSA